MSLRQRFRLRNIKNCTTYYSLLQCFCQIFCIHNNLSIAYNSSKHSKSLSLYSHPRDTSDEEATKLKTKRCQSLLAKWPKLKFSHSLKVQQTQYFHQPFCKRSSQKRALMTHHQDSIKICG